MTCSLVYRLDHILLETTGLANPAPLASILWLDDQLESAVKLDSVITVSVMTHFMTHSMYIRFLVLKDVLVMHLCLSIY